MIRFLLALSLAASPLAAQSTCPVAGVRSQADTLIAEANRSQAPRKTVIRRLANRLYALCPAVTPTPPPDTVVPPPPGPTPPPDPVALATPTAIAPGSTASPGPALTSTTPTFSWSAVSEATGYVVAVRDLMHDVIVYPSASGAGTPVTGTALTLPSGILRGDGVVPYRWDVTAVSALAKSLPSANRYFTVLVPTPPPADTQPPPPPSPPPPPPTGSSAAELPRVYLNFQYPTSTRTINVAAGANLQAALNAAQNGDELALACGATWTGNYTLPVRSGGWVVIRSACLSQLPPIGTRVTPSFAALMPKIVTPNASAALAAIGPTSGWWLAGIDVAVAQVYTGPQYGIITLGGTQTSVAAGPSNIVLDRMYVHGYPATYTQRCVGLNAARVQVTDSWLDECHATDIDAQAIGGWNGAGPYKIVNNHLAGSGENIIFGGADPATPGLVAADVEIRRNYIYTPPSWRGRYVKKHQIELKAATRVLIEGNILDGTWEGSGGTGVAVIWASTNQGGGCRACRVTDITFRRNLIRNAAGGIGTAAAISPQGSVDTTTRRITISENVLDNLGVGADGNAATIKAFLVFDPTFDVTIERNVATGPYSVALQLEGNLGGTIRAVFRDNVWNYGTYGVHPSVTGGAPGAVWLNQTFIAPPQPGYPAGTLWVSSESQAPLAAQIRAIVQQATAGVVVQP